MKKRILSFLTMLCMVATLLPANIITVSAYDGMQYDNYLYYKVNDYGEVAITDCDESVTDVIIPAEIDNKRVIGIDNSAFSNCSSLTSIDIPNSIIYIGGSAFAHCSSLTSIDIPDSVTFIGKSAFAHCSSLKSITLPNSITYILDLTFCGCSSLTSIDIPDSVTYIGESAFCGCSSLTSITIPNSITKIDWNLFEDCTSLININIPDSVTSICDCAFWGCSSLTSIDIPDSVTYIGRNAFRHCSSLTSIDMPDSVTSNCFGTFWDCSSLTSIDIPDGVTYIDCTFYGCSSLTSITIPNSVAYIDSEDFRDCTGLKTVYYKGTAEDWSHIVYISPYDDILTNTEIIYLKCTKTTVSNNGKVFTVKPKNIPSGNTVILALYNGNQLVEAKTAAYTGDDIPFTTDKTYTNARVMVWNDFDDITPICEAEIVKLNV